MGWVEGIENSRSASVLKRKRSIIGPHFPSGSTARGRRTTLALTNSPMMSSPQVKTFRLQFDMAKLSVPSPFFTFYSSACFPGTQKGTSSRPRAAVADTASDVAHRIRRPPGGAAPGSAHTVNVCNLSKSLGPGFVCSPKSYPSTRLASVKSTP